MLTNSKELKKIAEEVVAKDYPYEHVGLRVQQSTYGLVIGDEITHESNRWNDGEMLDEMIGGISAVSASLAEKYDLGFGAYEGCVVLVIGSNSASHGHDDGEIIMHPSYGQHPVILDIIDMGAAK
jgi:hypothetical protein